jgi:anti-sigma B factor antagonist
MALKVTSEEKGSGIYTVRPVGSIDANTHTILGSQVDTIFTKSPKLIIFDMKDVQYVSSAGISVILAAEKFLSMTGGKVLMVNLQPQIRKVFEIVQALPAQQIFASAEEMDTYLAAIQRKVKDGEIE